MTEGYCVKCKAKKEIVDAVEETMKNGRKAIKGRCPTCGVVMFKILGGKPIRDVANNPPPAESTNPDPTRQVPSAPSSDTGSAPPASPSSESGN
jgi:hypothetical protein